VVKNEQNVVAKLEPEGDKREAILRAALELFSERGFYGTAVPLIAERAKVATGTIYRHFKDKESLVAYCPRRAGFEFVS
jgi:AcrR family transcriptional regulator